ncbi:MAG TPA: acetate/propionate family kinase [Patescibacteria group bacterium]|nr:acetate/propionate family kinase [Patescibacteria group bacterium]
MRILVVNAGSSSLKLRLLGEGDAPLAAADLPPGVADASLAEALDRFGRVDAVGHRIVHGGVEFRDPVIVDDGLVARIAALGELAPLHQPAAVAALRAARTALPAVPHVACFDTAFHARLPPAAATYALPAAWRGRFGLRRFGFHGLSHAHASRRAAELLGRAEADVHCITCHLGAGASLAAVRGGRSVDTTMGFTPLEGLVMATRSGSVDPGLLLWLQQRAGVAVDELADGLEHRSGLTGLAGTADMREVLRRAAADDAAAVLARDVYVHRLSAGIAAMAAALPRVDAVVFTGGVGENAAEIRARALAGVPFLAVELDAEANMRGSGDRVIGLAGDSSTRALVVSSREDLEIARQVRSVLA